MIVHIINGMIYQKGVGTTPPPHPIKPQLAPHQHNDPSYREKVQYAKDVDSSEVLDAAKITWVQSIVGALLFYA